MSASRFLATAFLASSLLFAAQDLYAHCDNIDGPVVLDARRALEAGSIAPVLKWVRPADEAELREVFAKTLAVRKAGGASAEVADRWFFETLVRVHRAGEEAPFTGLKPAGTELEPAIAAGDKAIESGSLEEVEKLVLSAARDGMRSRFEQLKHLKEHAEHNAEAGRAYTAAYADFLHYVERIHVDAMRKPLEKHEH
jgi:hypothetical protein